MRFSVVIPVYNVASYLTGCVSSVLNSTETDYEIILVDDGSTDGRSGPLCDTLAARCPNRIRVIHQKTLAWAAPATPAWRQRRENTCFSWMGDDTISPEALSILSQAVEKFHHPDVIAFFLELWPEGGSVPTGLQRHRLPPDQVCTLAQCPAMLLDTPSACARLWRRELFLKSGIRYPERLWYEDLYTTENLLLEANSIVGLHVPLYRYLLRTGSIMRGNDPSRNREILLALDQVFAWYRSRQCFYPFSGRVVWHDLTTHQLCLLPGLTAGSSPPLDPTVSGIPDQPLSHIQNVEILPCSHPLPAGHSVFSPSPPVPAACAPAGVERKEEFQIGGI